MQLEEQSYAGKTFRPKPEVHIDATLKLVAVCTSWSTKSFAKEFINNFIGIFSSLSDDAEATSPFEIIESLSMKQNNLRTALLLSNKEMSEQKNKNEYVHGCEFFVGVMEGESFSWIHFGNPSLFIRRENSGLIASGAEKDLSLDFASGNLNAPVPENLLGLHPSISFDVKSCKLKPNDQIYLLSTSAVQPFMRNAFEQSELTRIAKMIAQHQPNSPFWLGKINFSQS